MKKIILTILTALTFYSCQDGIPGLTPLDQYGNPINTENPIDEDTEIGIWVIPSLDTLNFRFQDSTFTTIPDALFLSSDVTISTQHIEGTAGPSLVSLNHVIPTDPTEHYITPIGWAYGTDSNNITNTVFTQTLEFVPGDHACYYIVLFGLKSVNGSIIVQNPTTNPTVIPVVYSISITW